MNKLSAHLDHDTETVHVTITDNESKDLTIIIPVELVDAVARLLSAAILGTKQTILGLPT